MGNKPIFNEKLATYLNALGFECVDMVPNKKALGQFVYFFSPTEELEVAMSTWMAAKERQNGYNAQKLNTP